MLFSALDPGKLGRYQRHRLSSLHFEKAQENQDQAIMTLPNMSFEKGKFYTIVVTGYLKGTPKLETLIVEDQLGAGPTALAGSHHPND